eukprot:jgi/Astpho2/5118/fgenesh1_pg.00073_%23_16_t
MLPRVKLRKQSPWYNIALIAVVALTCFALGRFSDLVVALPADAAHVPVVAAGRQWRGTHSGIRTLVAVNDEALAQQQQGTGAMFGEYWVAYPDDVPLRAKHPGDTRAAFVPWLAHQAFADRPYKWLLYGDDDTLWFVDGVFDLVKDLDPGMPYFISDNLWWSDVQGAVGNQPNLNAPRCLPCGHKPEEFMAQDGWRPFDAPVGCPCTPELLCGAPDLKHFFSETCAIPRHGDRTYSIHGGAGGDALIMICLWQLGVAVSDPGFSFYHSDLRMFDSPSAEGRHLLYALTEALAKRCDPSCQVLLRHMVSTHVRSAVHGIEASASMIKAISNAYELWRKQIV